MAADVDRWWRATAKLAKQLDKEPAEVVVAVRAKLEDFQVGSGRRGHRLCYVHFSAEAR